MKYFDNTSASQYRYRHSRTFVHNSLLKTRMKVKQYTYML